MTRKIETFLIDGKKFLISGIFPRIARIKSEYYEWVDDPYGTVAKIKTGGVNAELFTFLQRVVDKNNKYNFYFEWDSIAVLTISTYDNWWKKQINDKTRNMIRKAQKSGVEVRIVEFSDELVRGIKEIYDESPLRQGKPFKHYRKDLVTLKNSHISFLERSEFIGAFYGNELIGFVKMVHDDGISHLMQIISKVEHRSKAPTNALIAKAVGICAQRQVPYLHYGVWSQKGLGDFKTHHAFQQFKLQRFFIPLNMMGTLALRFKLHRNLAEHLPQKMIDILITMRKRWNERIFYVHKT